MYASPRYRPIVRILLALAILASPSFGQSFPASFDLSTLDGTNGFVLDGIDNGDNAGWSVSGIGDLNGDGVSDFIIGARRAAPGGIADAGECYVVFGSGSGFPASVDLASLNGATGFVLNGIDPIDFVGERVSDAGDVNEDGISDLVIGSANANPGGRLSAGQAYVIFGSTSGFPASLDLDALDGTNGFVVNGALEGDFVGASVSGAGDVNADGVDDLVIGASGRDPNGQNFAGGAYVVFGSSSGFPAAFELSSLSSSDGFFMDGLGLANLLGSSVSDAGDLNDDGIADFMIGTGPSTRETYVVFGAMSSFGTSLDLTTLNGTNGFIVRAINSSDAVGTSMSSAGDVNGDGVSDVLLGAPSVDSGVGECYVLFGTTSGFPALLDLSTLNGSNGFVLRDSTLQGSNGRSVSGAGDVNGDGLDDVILGAWAADPEGRMNAGASYVVFGAPSFPSLFELASLDGSNGFVVNGLDATDSLGSGVSGVGDVNGDGTPDLLLGAYNRLVGSDRPGGAYVIYGAGAGCKSGTANLGNGFPIDLLYLQGTTGGLDRSVAVSVGELIRATMVKPGSGGNGKFVLHANNGAPSVSTETDLPFDIGTACFPFLLNDGASPVIVANNIGKPGKVGASSFLGIDWDDPERATTEMVYPSLPIGTVMTFQGLIVDPASLSSRAVSLTNAVTMTVVP